MKGWPVWEQGICRQGHSVDSCRWRAEKVPCSLLDVLNGQRNGSVTPQLGHGFLPLLLPFLAPFLSWVLGTLQQTWSQGAVCNSDGEWSLRSSWGKETR